MLCACSTHTQGIARLAASDHVHIRMPLMLDPVDLSNPALKELEHPVIIAVMIAQLPFKLGLEIQAKRFQLMLSVFSEFHIHFALLLFQ